MTQSIDVYLESGKKRTFAGAIEWPGWCRSGRDEQSALASLLEYGDRYARAVQPANLGFTVPSSVSAFRIVERLSGGSTTDFGAPEAVPAADSHPLTQADLGRFQTLLQALWGAFDAAVRSAVGKELRKGPRGGGRDLEGVVAHVVAAEAGYLRALAQKVNLDDAQGLDQALALTRQAVLNGLSAAYKGELPATGPRGGKIWLPRYFIRRYAWHLLDHAWEIEDRVVETG